MLFAVGRGHEHRYILAHHFFLDISEQPFGGGAERQYRAVIVDHHHGVGHGRQYRADMGFALRLSPLGRPFLGYVPNDLAIAAQRSEEHTSELQSTMRKSYAVFCLKKKKN